MTRYVTRSAAAVSLFLVSATISAAQFVCLPNGAPITISGVLNTGDPLQTGRIARDGRPSTCVGQTNVLQNTTPVHYDSFNFSNPTGQQACVTIDFDHLGCGVNQTQINAYSVYNPSTPATGVIGDPGLSSTGRGSFSFSLAAGAPFTIVEHEITPNSGCANYSFTVNYAVGCKLPGYDIDNDRRADFAVFRDGSPAVFHVLDPETGYSYEIFGTTGDIPVPGDYTGDGQTDAAVYRTSQNTWYTALDHVNGGQHFAATPWGIAGDIPVTGDYDRDGKNDVSVWRPGDGTFYALRSFDNTFFAFQWGTNGDVPVSGDFDGDGKADLAVIRPNDPGAGGTTWHIRQSNFDYSFFRSRRWGRGGDNAVVADYDGDGISDVAVFRSGIWYISQSSILTGDPSLTVQYGQSGDIPQAADYDGDGKADLAIYRPSNGDWHVLLSSGQGERHVHFGLPTDQPVSSLYRYAIPGP